MAMMNEWETNSETERAMVAGDMDCVFLKKPLGETPNVLH